MLPRIECEVLLDNLILNLNKYPCELGGEGATYFIDKNYVVKTYYETDNLTDKIFNLYCDELNRYTMIDTRLPRIYAWTIKENVYGGSDYYILEQRINGKTLVSNIDLSYYFFKELMSNEEFKDIIHNRDDERKGEFEILFELFLENYLEMMHEISNLPKQELDLFMRSVYDSAVNLNYSYQDLHGGNLILGKKKLFLIDNAVNFATGEKDRESFYCEMISELILMYTCFSSKNLGFIKRCSIGNEKILKKYSELLDVSIENLCKMLSSLNEHFAHPKYAKIRREISKNNLIKYFGEKRADKVEELLDKSV